MNVSDGLSGCSELREWEELGSFRHGIRSDIEITSMNMKTIHPCEGWFQRFNARFRGLRRRRDRQGGAGGFGQGGAEVPAPATVHSGVRIGAEWQKV